MQVPEVNEEFEQDAEFLKLYMGLEPGVRSAIGHRNQAYESIVGTVKSLISACTYRGTECSTANYWHESFTASYGTCYTFEIVDEDT